MAPPPNPATAYISNLHTGAQIGLAQAQLAQRAQLAEQELEARERERQQRAVREQQEIEFEHAYKQAELGMQQQKLAEEKQLSDLKVQDAARRFAAQQRVQMAIASGQSPEEAMLAEAANLDMGAGDLGALMRAKMARTPFQPKTEEINGTKLVQLGPNRWAQVREPPGMRDYGPVQTEDLGGGAMAVTRKGSPGVHVIKRGESKPRLSLAALASLAKEMPTLADEAKRKGKDSMAAKMLDKITKLLEQAEQQDAKADFKMLPSGKIVKADGGAPSAAAGTDETMVDPDDLDDDDPLNF